VRFGTGSALYTGLTVATNRKLWEPQKGNFGPQLGFNWSPDFTNGRLVIRGGYGLNFNQQEIAITANAGFNPPTQSFYSFSFNSPTNPGTNGGKIIYGTSSSPTSLFGFASNPNTITTYNSAGLPTSGSANIIIIGDGTGKMPTTYLHHFSLDTQYQFGRELVASVGYQGSLGRHLINHQTPNAPAVVAGVPLNPLVTSGDFWINGGSSSNNALLLELNHPMVHHFQLDAQFMWAKSLDTDGSGPFYEDPYFPLNPAYSYGVSDFNIGKTFKLYGLWQPVLFHGEHGWLEKIAGQWSLSGILNIHTGFPYSPNFGTSNSLYCTQCGYFNVRPYYLGGGKDDRSNKAFINATNYAGITSVGGPVTGTVNGTPNTVIAYTNKYFSVPNLRSAMQAASGTGFPNPNLTLPPPPGLGRNAFTGPGYRDLDASLAKGFGFPNNRLTGENARVEVRADVFNLFNIQNLNPANVTNDITSSTFGRDVTVLGGRTVTLQARFSF
jgi:hypothetical protein